MRIKKILFIFLLIVITFLVCVFCYLFFGSVKPANNISWGMNFSQRQATDLGLDWKATYTALLKDMGVKKLKVGADWDLIEPEKGKYNFDDLDWQIKEAEKYNAKILLAFGMKTPRWPECHIPDWAGKMDKESQQKAILNLDEKIVSRYKNSSTIWAWQVENEPFFLFGECSWVDKNFLKQEIAQTKSIDPTRKILISDTGELSSWFNTARLGDIIGVTTYRKVWFTMPGILTKYIEKLDSFGMYIDYPLTPAFYGNRAKLIEKIFHKEVIGVELQAEPWCQKVLKESPLREQEKSMNPEQFQKNIDFAKKTGLPEFYLWGGEWMYWMKTTQNNPEIWNEAKKLFTQ